jgi:hypothetical protein
MISIVHLRTAALDRKRLSCWRLSDRRHDHSCFRRRLFIVSRVAAFLILSIGLAVASGEERPAAIGPHAFHIPALPLIDALQIYSRQTGVQVMFETVSAAGYQSEPVDGDFTPEAALRKLLADTDLKIRYSRSSAVTLAPASAPSPDDPPSNLLASVDMVLEPLHVNGARDPVDRDRLGEYIVTLQSDIQKSLNKVSRTRRGEYRVAVKVWVASSSRIVERAELDGSTGDQDRDSTIAEALRGMTLSQQAPPNTPRPIRFMISIHAL